MPQLYPVFGIWPLYLAIVVSGIGSGFLGPASFAFNSEVLPKELLANGAAWNSSTWQTGAIVGPMLGGLVAGFFGISVAYGIDVALVIFSSVAMLLIPDRPFQRKMEKEPIRESLKAGWRFVFRNQPVWGSLSLDLFAVLFGGAVAMLPVYASEILHVGPQGLGLLQSAPAVGAVLVSVFMAHRPLRGNVGNQILLTVAAFGLTIILFAVTTNIYLSLFLLVLYGATDSVSVIIRSTVIQVLTPNEMRGRVAAVNSMFIGTSNEIGAFESGVAAKVFGLVPSVLFGGIMTIVSVAIIGSLAPKLRELRGEQLR
jgi:MFS family permease